VTAKHDHLAYSRDRRARLRAAGVCINGESHGRATHGVLCESCRLIHRKSAGSGWLTRKPKPRLRDLIAAMAERIVIDVRRETRRGA